MNVVIAGGGTGGHLFPGIAIAQALIAKTPDTEILFIGTKREMERAVLAQKGFPLKRISAQGIKGKGLFGQLRAAAAIPCGIVQSGVCLHRFKADIVVGVGGYSSGPAAVAALFMKIPVVIHEQNVLPGLTNRLLERVAVRVFVSFPESVRYFDAQKTVITGNPVRRDVLSARAVKKDPKRFTVLVAGGSQGAHRVNEIVVDALRIISEIPDIRFIHQTGKADAQWVRRAYRKLGRDDRIEPFIDDMGAVYGAADLVVCRAGATTVAEIAVLGKAAIFIPFPFAADNHQEANALGLSEQNAAELIREQDLDGNLLAERIVYYKGHRAELKKMGERAAGLGVSDAAERIAEEILNWSSTRPIDYSTN